MRTAAPPSSKSTVSWSPAVPPPPACGGPEGTGLDGEVVVAEGAVCGVVNTDDGLTVALGVAVAVAVGLVPAVWLVPAVGLPVVLAGAVALPVLVAGAEPDTEGMVGVEVEPPPEHADIVVTARTVSAPAPISLALSVSPATVVRSLMEPPHAPYAMFRFPVPASQTRAARTVRNNA
jgi:hypothetical protein